jgi:predicted metal-dependent enzyme (double-stranded beta helix superfamily)
MKRSGIIVPAAHPWQNNFILNRGLEGKSTMTSPYTLEQYVDDLRAITAQETDPEKITERVEPLARRFAKEPGWFRPEFRECDPEQGFSLHILHEEPNHDLAVFLISWLPNRGTTPHNHKTWAVVVGMEGQEQEDNYERLDDGSKPGYADLKRNGAQVMTAGDVTRCYPEHIHSVWNVGNDISMSLHTYGRHINYTGRSEFDPEGKREKPYLVKVADEHARA